MHIWNRCALVACIAGLVLMLPLRGEAQTAALGSWSGTLEAGGAELRLVFHIERGDDGGLTATMDSPDQGATGIPVSDVTVTEDGVTLTVAQIGGTYEGTLTSGGSKIEGTWAQGGRSFSLTLTPADETSTTPPSRPQHPEPPHSYVQDTVAFQNESADITLAGTLTRPEGKGPHPAVVLISGSGPQNRNSEVFNHELFLVLADHLTRQGIAVLRYDERGVGDSEGTYEGATSEDFSGDVAAAARFLKTSPMIDSGRVGLLGMSEGGLLAPMVHTRLEAVDFLVLMAGPSVPGSKILVEQRAKIAAARGASSSAVDSLRRVQRRVMEIIRTAPDSAVIAEKLRPIFDEQGASAKQIQSQIEEVTSPWFRYFVRHDPAPALRQVDVPVLALYGSNDLQVPPGQNVDPMRKALQKSPSDDVTVRVLEGLNHLFQPAETGLPGRYAQIDTTMASRALDIVSGWIREQTSTR